MNPYYYCELCDHASQQKGHSDTHLKSNVHIQKCNVYKCNILEKTELLTLLNEYKVSLNGTIHQIYDNILLQKSQLRLTKEEIVIKQKNIKKIKYLSLFVMNLLNLRWVKLNKH